MQLPPPQKSLWSAGGGTPKSRPWRAPERAARHGPHLQAQALRGCASRHRWQGRQQRGAWRGAPHRHEARLAQSPALLTASTPAASTSRPRQPLSSQPRWLSWGLWAHCCDAPCERNFLHAAERISPRQLQAAWPAWYVSKSCHACTRRSLGGRGRWQVLTATQTRRSWRAPRCCAGTARACCPGRSAAGSGTPRPGSS